MDRFDTALNETCAFSYQQWEVLLDAEDCNPWYPGIRPQASADRATGVDPNDILHCIQRYERPPIFGDLPSEAMPGPDWIGLGAQFTTNDQHWDPRDYSLQIASRRTKQFSSSTIVENGESKWWTKYKSPFRHGDGATGGNNTASRPSHHGNTSRPSTLTYEIPSLVTGLQGQHAVNALGDACAMNNFISPGCAAKLGLKVDTANRKLVTVGSGARARTAGTVEALFHFKDEPNEGHSELFHILPNAVQELVLGKPFLDLTRTFRDKAKRLSRVKERIMSTLSQYRLCYLGTGTPRFTGLLSGIPMIAMADTGSNVLVMDEDYADRLGILILRGSKYKNRLTFADGTTKMTSGIAPGVQWQFGLVVDHPDHILDFHILKNAPAEVILNDSLIFETDAFDEYECWLVDDEAEQTYEDDDTVLGQKFVRLAEPRHHHSANYVYNLMPLLTL